MVYKQQEQAENTEYQNADHRDRQKKENSPDSKIPLRQNLCAGLFPDGQHIGDLFQKPVKAASGLITKQAAYDKHQQNSEYPIREKECELSGSTFFLRFAAGCVNNWPYFCEII